MKKTKHYPGIDYFRILAAILIITIHTSPLASVSQTGDFILTRIIARLAVPFFFMTTGFFLITPYAQDSGKLLKSVKRTALIYAAAIAVYVPINLYNGYFSGENLLPNILKDIVFDGTLYHLWYLPASILGACITWGLVRKLQFRKALIISGVLYLIGLLGDSYYGLAEKIPAVSGFYGLLFQIMDHTRNGLFFAPIYFVLGGYLAESRHDSSVTKNAVGFVVSFAAMFAEGLLLRSLGWQRHDSMYVLLVPASFFLFRLLMVLPGKRIGSLRDISLLVYILHPMVIVVIRLAAKIVHLESLLIDNSIIHFLAVSVASVAGSVILVMLYSKFQKKPAKALPRAYIEVDLDHLTQNVHTLQEAMQPGCELMAVLKANAYGHGLFESAAHLHRLGVRAYAVATIDEGITLRRYGITGDILILGYTSPSRARDLRKYDLIQTIVDDSHALALEQQGQRIRAHLKIDSGMHRLGFRADDVEAVSNAYALRNVHIEGIFTHLCASDSLHTDDVAYTQQQLAAFQTLVETLRKTGLDLGKVHIQSSYGLVNYPQLVCAYARIGIILYGVHSSKHDDVANALPLQPVMALKSSVASLRHLSAGESAGYSRAFTAQRDSRLAAIPIGYADGIPRNLSCGKGFALVCGRKVPIVGRVCMDQLTLDVTDVPDVQVGSAVTFIGRDGEMEITAEDFADAADTITNEVFTRLGPRLTVKVK